jgi:hypothetical protein
VRWRVRAIALLAPWLLLLAASELGLRLLRPNPPAARLRSSDPAVHRPDPDLGWRSKAGHYELPPYSRAGTPIDMRFYEDGSRRASAAADSGGTPLLLFGGSFAQGWAISDDETLAWKLQLRFADAEVSNYGTGGHGGYQSLLFMERELAARGAGAIALYAFTGHHTTRNVAPSSWMRLLHQQSARGHVDVPYVTLGPNGELLRNEPERWVPWPGSSQLRVLEFLQIRLANLRDRWGRAGQERAVSEQILLDMGALARSQGARFAVALLSAKRQKAEHYRRFLEHHGVPVVDCNSFPLRRDQIVPGEGHPNAAMNSQWASCVGYFLEANFGGPLLPSSPPEAPPAGG